MEVPEHRGMSRTNFENLAVYQLAERLGDEIWKIVLAWPILPRDTIGKQIVRSADGVGANIAEGAGRGSFSDNRRFIHMARGSLNETKHWLRRAFKRSLLTEQQISSLKPILDELGPRLNAYLKSIDRRLPNRAGFSGKRPPEDSQLTTNN
jgi:four helix bundle protein